MMSELKRVLSQHHAQEMRGKLGGSAMCICGQGCGSTEACGEYAILLRDLTTATAKIEALEAKLATAERLINEINDARAANWHLQRRRENDQFEWFSSTADSVFGPFPTALEAFAAVRKENTGA